MGTEDNVIRFAIGVFVSLGASFMDALGLNILKLDHVKEAKRDKEHQRGDCGRPLWHMGLYTYIASQLIGSTIALSKLCIYSCNLSFIADLLLLLPLPLLDYLKTQVFFPLCVCLYISFFTPLINQSFL